MVKKITFFFALSLDISFFSCIFVSYQLSCNGQVQFFTF